MSLHEHEISEEHDSLQAMIPAKKNQVMWMFSIAVGIVVIILGGLLITGTFSRMLNPGAYVAKAAANTSAAMQEEKQAMAENLPVLKAAKTYMEQPWEEYFSFSVDKLPDSMEQYRFLLNLALTYNAKTDIDGRNMEAVLDVLYNNGSVTDAQIYAKDNMLAVNISELTGDTYYGMDTTKWVESYEASALKNIFGELNVDSDANFNIFDEMAKSNEVFQVESNEEALKLYFTEETISGMNELNKQLYAEIIFKNDGKEVVAVNGKNTDCFKINGVITKDALVQYIDSAYALVKADTKFTEYLNSQLKVSAAGSEMSAEEMQAAVWSAYDEAVASLKNSLSQDVAATFYVNDSKLVKTVANTVLLAEDNSTMPLSMSVQIGDGKYLSNHVNVNLVCTTPDGRVKMELDSKGNHTGADNALDSRTKVLFDLGGEMNVNVDFNMYYDSKLSDDNAGMTYGMTMTDSAETVEVFLLDAHGTVLADVDAKTMSADIHSIDLTVMDEEIEMSAEWGCQPLTVDESTFTVVEPVDIMAMTEDELNVAAQEMMENAIIHVKKLSFTTLLGDVAAVWG